MMLRPLTVKVRGLHPTIRRGIAAAEMAMLAPLFGTILVGMFELSRGLMGKETLSNAARKACRTGIQRDKGSTDIWNDVMNIMTDNGYDSTKFNPPPVSGAQQGQSYIGSINITVTDPNGNSLTDAMLAPTGSVVSVQVAIPVTSVLWTSSFFYLQDTVLESETVVMMKQ